MAKFSKEEFDELLLGLDSYHESIVNSSSKFLNLEPEGFEPASQVYFDTFRNIIEHSILKDKVDWLLKLDPELTLSCEWHFAEGKLNGQQKSSESVPSPDARHRKSALSM